MNRHHAYKSGENNWFKLTLAVASALLLIAPACKKQNVALPADNTRQTEDEHVDKPVGLEAADTTKDIHSDADVQNQTN